jgi:hypothetical protein
MIGSFAVFLFLLNSALNPAYPRGDAGLYTQKASFKKPGQAFLNITGSIGNKHDTDLNESSIHNQIAANFQYAPFSRMLLGIGGTSYRMEGEAFNGAYAEFKLPLLTLGPITCSIAPAIFFSTNRKPASGGNILIDLLPFSKGELPPLLLSNSLSLLRHDGLNEYRVSSVLTFNDGRFLPFVEVYTEFHDRIEMQSTFNSRLSTGLGMRFPPLNVRAAVEIPLDDKDERDFDFRFSGELGVLFNVKRKPKVTLSIMVLDEASETPINATISVKGKEVENILECIDGRCQISGLLPGLYTIQIEHPGYKKLKSPLFLKDKPIERTYRLSKIEELKGGD